MAITALSSGSRPNVLPATASAVLDARYPTTFGFEDLRDALLGALGDEVEVESLQVLPAVAGRLDSPLARRVAELAGAEVEPTGMNYFTDLSRLARASSEIVIFGPGEPSLAHAVDERCDIDAIAASAKVFQELWAT